MNRQPKQSQLDYLWVNFGSYSVSDKLEQDTIPTSGLLDNLVTSIKEKSLNSLKVVNNQLVGNNINGTEIFNLDISEITSGGKSITNFGRRYITQTDIDNGCAFPLDTPVYYIRFSDNTELIAKIDSYDGAETNSIVINVDNNQISGQLKINNEDSIVILKETKLGIQADLKVSTQESSIQLSKELEGLKARIILDNKGRQLQFKLLSLSQYLDTPKKDHTTVYFIEGKQYFYFGEYKIGGDTTNLDNYYTKDETDNLISDLATRQYVTEQLQGVGMEWNNL